MNSKLRRIAAAAFAAPLLALAVAPAASAATTPPASSVDGGIIIDIALSLTVEIGDEVWIDGILYVYIGGGAFQEV